MGVATRESKARRRAFPFNKVYQHGAEKLLEAFYNKGVAEMTKGMMTAREFAQARSEEHKKPSRRRRIGRIKIRCRRTRRRADKAQMRQGQEPARAFAATWREIA